jgi:hypothetical protein
MKNKIETTDIYLTAALLALGFKLDGVDKSDLRHMRFSMSMQEPVYTFKSENIPPATVSASSIPMDFEYYENEWANGTLMINAIHFKDSIQRMKSVIHSK